MTKKVDQPTKVFNGQIWHQLEFPFFQIMVLMLVDVDGELQFCKVGICEFEVPLIMTDTKGRWQYSNDELFDNLSGLGYTYIGNGTVGLCDRRLRIHGDCVDDA